MTTTNTTAQRWEEIKTIWHDNRWLYILAGVILGLLIPPLIKQVTGDFNNLINNLVPEAVGIIFTVFILERLAENRQRENYKRNLIRQAGSISNDFAVDAIDQLNKAGWLTGASSVLQGENLQDANLEKARLFQANLQHAILWSANLQHASLASANLQYAGLVGVNLRDADLRDANLQHTSLMSANLQEADLRNTNVQYAVLWTANLQHTDLLAVNFQYTDLDNANLQHVNLSNSNLQYANLGNTKLQYTDLVSANLQHANLSDANLQHAFLWTADLQYADLGNANLQHTNLSNTNLRNVKNIKTVQFDEKTVLPDALPLDKWDEDRNRLYDKYWTLDTDMTRYTNPEHPDFWEPELAKVETVESVAATVAKEIFRYISP